MLVVQDSAVRDIATMLSCGGDYVDQLARFQPRIHGGLELGGSYYLTYHRWATRDQVLQAHPALPQFLAEKRNHDPDERFQSEWYRYYRGLLSEAT